MRTSMSTTAHAYFLAHIYIHIMQGSHTFDLSTPLAEREVDLCDLEDSLVYIASPGQPEQQSETLPQKRHRQQSRQSNQRI